MATIKFQNATILTNVSWIENDFTLLYLIEFEDGETVEMISGKTNNNTIATVSNSISSFSANVHFNENTTFSPRSVIVTITVVTNLGSFSKTILMVQEALSFSPVYIDKVISVITEADYINYYIKCDDEIIFNGKAYRLPNENKAKININEVCQNYLSSPRGNLPGYVRFPNVMRKFDLYVNSLLHSSYYFYNCYYPQEGQLGYTLYEGYYYLKTSAPINRKIDKKQVFSYSYISLNEHSLTAYFYDEDHNLIHTTSATDVLYTSAVRNFTVTSYPDAKYLNILGDWFEIEDTCATHCLYYSNACGGCDCFLIKGNVKKSDEISQHTYTKKVEVKTKPTDFAIKKYQNDIKTKWVLYTDWLTDDEASRMYHLLESTEVYLTDLNNPTAVIPVNIINNSCEYKTYSNNGRKKFNYTIEVEEANTKIRR